MELPYRQSQEFKVERTELSIRKCGEFFKAKGWIYLSVKAENLKDRIGII